ncbi:hypothetical protein CUJ83_10630 [Methanocella sp. CWC-04]|uniref:Uncharacterized protein n=1 Tax=Methanooceanicella nereidis TaxID=2052831 RepID=A0AAP2W7Q4_9EURY|nr:hypothetical protein [Methanocella sp. CWC-04]MCD1295454.1 hypothetical protein [Methanocella sp. CWC-04]
MTGADKSNKGKSLFDLSDIMSILEDESTDQVLKVVDSFREVMTSESDNNTGTSVLAEPAETSTALVPFGQNKPVPVEKTQDNAFVSKLLYDIDQKNAEIDQKNAEILRLNNEIMNLKFESKDKELKIKELSSKVEELTKVIEETKSTVKSIECAPVKPIVQKAHEPVYNIKEDTPEDEDVATIFKRLQRGHKGVEEPVNEVYGDDGADSHDPYSDNPQPPRKKRTAKLYDL